MASNYRKELSVCCFFYDSVTMVIYFDKCYMRKTINFGYYTSATFLLCLGRDWLHQDAVIYYSILSSLYTLYSYLQHR